MNRNLLLIVFLLVYQFASAQGGFEWIQHHGDGIPFYVETVYDIQTDRGGNVYVAGQVNDLWVRDSSGNKIKSKSNPNLDSLYNHGGKDVWLAKYSPQGQILWHRYAGSGADDRYFDMVADQDGNCYVAGQMKWHNLRPPSSFGRKVLSNDSLWTFIAKIDSGGNLLWHKPFGGDTISNSFIPYSAEIYNLSIYNDKIFAFILGGGAGPFGYQLLFDKDSLDMGIHEAIFDLNGNYLGVKSFPFPNHYNLPNIQSIQANGSGRFITAVLEDTVFVANDTIVNAGLNSAMILGFDTNLSHLWTFRSYNYFDQFLDSKIIGDTLVVSGHYSLFNNPTVYFDTIDHTNTSQTQGGGVFVFQASTGKLLGLYPSKGAGGLGARADAASAGAGNQYFGIGGSFRRKLTFSGTNNYIEAESRCINCTNRDLFFSVFDRSGNFVAEDVIYSSSVNSDAVKAMHFNDSMLYIGGFVGDTVIVPGVDTFVTEAENDAFVAAYKLPVTTSLEEAQYIKANNGILAYPNPSRGRMALMGKAVGEEAYLYNISGQLVQKFYLDKHAFKQEINLGNIENGVYFLVIPGKTENQQLKIVKSDW